MFHSLYVRKHVFSVLAVLLISLSMASMPGIQTQALAQNRTLPDFTDLVEQVGPSVVNIRTIDKTAPQSAAQNQPMDPQDEEMQELFRRFLVCPCQTHRANNALTDPNNNPKNNRAVWVLALS